MTNIHEFLLDLQILFLLLFFQLRRCHSIFSCCLHYSSLSHFVLKKIKSITYISEFGAFVLYSHTHRTHHFRHFRVQRSTNTPTFKHTSGLVHKLQCTQVCLHDSTSPVMGGGGTPPYLWSAALSGQRGVCVLSPATLPSPLLSLPILPPSPFFTPPTHRSLTISRSSPLSFCVFSVFFHYLTSYILLCPDLSLFSSKPLPSPSSSPPLKHWRATWQTNRSPCPSPALFA